MVETKQQGDAFDEYYAMGSERSFVSLVGHCNVTRRTIARWSKAFNWQERIIQRDLENNKKTEEKTDKAIVNTKADYRADIGSALEPVMSMLNGVMEKGADGKLKVSIEVETAKDFSLIVGALEKLIKADLLLIGEPDSHTQLSGTGISFNFGDKITEDDI